MEQDYRADAGMPRWESCGNCVPGHDSVHYGSLNKGYRLLCTRCFNVEVAQQLGMKDFESSQFSHTAMTDCEGTRHEFHFRTRLHGPMLSLGAFEIEDGAPAGYQFQILGDAEDDQFLLLGRLVERMRRSLSVKHLVQSKHGQQIADQTGRGRIDWDATAEGRIPLLVVDGRNVSWEEFGRMLMKFEGSQFRMGIVDRSDEV